MTSVTELFARVTGRKKERDAARIRGVTELVVVLGDAELGASENDFDLDSAAAILEKTGLSEADLRKNIELYKDRCKWAELTAEVGRLRQAAEDKWEELRRADAAEAERRREFARMFEASEAEAQQATRRAVEASGAEAELHATADRSAEQPLVEEQQAVNAQVAGLQQKLNATMPLRLGGIQPSIGEFPAAVLAQAKIELASLDRQAVAQPALRKQLLERIAAAEKAVADTERQLRRARKQRDTIQGKLEALAAEHLKPENFELVRARPTRDELAKRHAARFGFGPDDIGFSHTTG